MYCLASIFCLFMQLSVFGFFVQADEQTYDTFNQAVWVGVIIEYVIWDLFVQPFIIYILAIFNKSARLAFSIY